MYRLLIVDDEVAIVMGLEKVLSECEEYELDIYKASGATEALEIARNKQVDILLADINMPGMNGLQLAKEIVKDNERCKVIYLTGFSNFDYIYEAMERMGSQYLLKSESDEKIMAAVGRAVNMLEEELHEQIEHTLAHMEKRKNDSLIKKDVIESLLCGEYSRNQLDIQFQKYQLNLNWEKGVYLFSAILHDAKREEEHLKILEGLYQAKLFMDERFEKEFYVESIVWDEKLPVWILQRKEEDRVINMRRYLQGAAEEFQKIMIQLNKMVFDVGYAAQKCPVDDIAKVFHGLIPYMEHSIVSEVPMIYDWEKCQENQEDYEQTVNLGKLENYIQEHIGEDVSLDHLAEIVHFNPSYLSRFYKKNRGITLSEYIANIRIVKAEKMLRDTEKKIADIAAELGFDTPSAFGAFFRKKTGQSPAKYRKII